LTSPHNDLSALDVERSLPSLPVVALDVLRVCGDPEGEIGELAEVLGRDPVLAAQVLRTANSAFYFRGNEATTLQRAAMVLGMQALKVVALGFTLANEMPRQGTVAGLDLPAYWHRSLLNAVISRSIAQSLELPIPEEAFLCGLFSDIGKLTLTHAIPERYAAVVEEAGGWPSEELERERLGFAASEAAETLLRAWTVPEVLVLGSTFAERREQLPQDAPYEARVLADVVALARIGVADIFDDERRPSTAWFVTEAQSRFGLVPEAIEQLVASLDEECFVAAGMLSIELPDGVSYQALLEQVRTGVADLSVEALPQLGRSAPAFVPVDWQT
jgi:HD-like signal output (HDOD) protein